MTTPPSHRRPHVLSLSGGIGSGKSTFAHAFSALGVACLDIDTVARAIHQNPDHPATQAVGRAFPAAMSADGRLARGSLRTVFASDPLANEELKRLLAPWVLAEAQRWTRARRGLYVVWESALSLGPASGAARLLVIDASEQVRLERIARRNPDWPAAQVAAILSLQPPRAAYLAAADDVIVNEGPLAQVAQMAAQLNQHYLTLWSQE